MTDLLDRVAREVGLSPRELQEVATRSADDPSFWGEFALGFVPWQKQREIDRALVLHRHVAVPACHAPGKSATAGKLVLWWMNTKVGPCVVTTAPTERQIRNIVWKEVHRWSRVAADRGVALAGELDTMRLSISPDEFAMGFASDKYNPNTFQGLHADSILVIADEACGLSDAVYDGIDGVMGGGHARLLELGNPVNPLTQFRYNCEDPEVKTIHISAYDTPNFNVPGHELREENFANNDWREKLGPYYDWNAGDSGQSKCPFPYLTTPEFVWKIYRTKGPQSMAYVSRVLGRFPEQSEESLLSIVEVEDAMQRVEVLDEEILNTPIELGVDVARFGSNETVVVAKMGYEGHWKARVIDHWGKSSQTVTCDRIQGIFDRFKRWGKAPLMVHVDATGLGGGYVDELERRGLPVVAFNSSQRENLDNEEAFNLRADAYLYLAGLLERRELDLPDDEELKKQLLSIRKFLPDNSEKMQIRGKEWMKANRIPSPDFADALSIAMRGGGRAAGDLGVSL